MSKANPSTKWGWGRSRDTIVSKEGAQASNNTIHQTTARMVAFNPQTRGQLPERPSTSGGPVSKQRNIQMRETRDDFYFNPLASHGQVTTFCNSPAPVSPFTPTASLKEFLSVTSPKLSSHSIRPLTPESLDTKSASSTISMEIPRAEIGMALGSPAHPPLAWQQNVLAAQTISPSPDPSIDDWHNSRAVKQKTKGWKMFGGLFGGRKPTSVEPFYQLQPEGSVRTVDTNGNFTDVNDSKPVKLRGRGRSVSGKNSKKDPKLSLQRAETSALGFDYNSKGRATPTPSIILDGEALDDKPYMRKRGKSLLDVDIPDIRMERYSIMFGSLLDDSSISSQSLAARRQAALEKLKADHNVSSIKEEELYDTEKNLRPRRATSPQMRNTHSPAFSLFPSTPSKKSHSPSPSRPLNSSSLQRSNTSPAALSPSRPSFAPGPENSGHSISISGDSGTGYSNVPVALHVSSLMNTDINPTTLEEGCVILTTSEPIAEGVYDLASMANSVNGQPQPTSHHVRAPEASVAGSTTSSSSASATSENSSTTASSILTPQCEVAIISRPLNIASPPLSSQSKFNRQTGHVKELPKPRSRSATRIATEAAARSRSSSLSNSREEAGDDSEEEQEAHIITADVSIARSISVSRQQRQLLVPIKTSNSVRRNPQKSQQRIGLGIRTISVGHVSSPLETVASAAQAERERVTSPVPEKRDRFPTPIRKQSYTQSMQNTERLVESTAKPATPTLVIVGDAGIDAREQRWAAATKDLKGSIAERRKIRKGLAPVTGEMRGRLVTASAVRGTDGDIPGHMYRKSEDVVVERVT